MAAMAYLFPVAVVGFVGLAVWHLCVVKNLDAIAEDLENQLQSANKRAESWAAAYQMADDVSDEESHRAYKLAQQLSAAERRAEAAEANYADVQAKRTELTERYAQAIAEANRWQQRAELYRAVARRLVKRRRATRTWVKAIQLACLDARNNLWAKESP